MDSLNVVEIHTVLFIIQGYSYDAFLKRVNEIKEVEDHFYSIMDKDLTYLLSNNDIPRWIVDVSVLIDQDNRIKMIGEPWATNEMKELFYSICQ